MKSRVKLLKSIRPNQEWVSKTRGVLLSQIASQGVVGVKPGVFEGIWAYTRAGIAQMYHYTFAPLLNHSTATALTLASLFVGVSVVHLASQDAVPGDTLYSVKKTGEGIQIALLPSQDQAKLHIEFTDKRLKELDTVVKQSLTNEDKDAKIGVLISEVQQNISEVKKHLETGDNQDVNATVKIASLMGDKMKRYQEVLESAKDASGNHDTGKKATQALKELDETNTKALTVIVEKKDAANVSEEEVSGKLEESVKNAKSKADKVEVKAASIAPNQDGKKSPVEDKAKEAKKILKEAEISLAKKDYKVTLDKLNQSKEIISGAEEELQKAPPISEEKEKEKEGKKEEVVPQSKELK